MIELLDLGRGLEGIFPTQTRHYDRARAENLAIQKGEVQFIPAPAPGSTPQPGMPPVTMPAAIYPDKSPFLLPSEDNDEIHIAAHQEIALDNAQPWAIRQNVLLHIAEHRANLAAKQAAANPAPLPAPLEGGPPGPALSDPRANAPERPAGRPQLHTITG